MRRGQGSGVRFPRSITRRETQQFLKFYRKGLFFGPSPRSGLRDFLRFTGAVTKSAPTKATPPEGTPAKADPTKETPAKATPTKGIQAKTAAEVRTPKPSIGSPDTAKSGPATSTPVLKPQNVTPVGW